MGNRANFVLMENGQAQIYFSRWGALDIPATLLAGPEATIAYIRSLTPDDSLLDCVWAEGGVLLDADDRRLLFWGGSKIASRPYLRRPLLPVLRLLWPSWSVQWAMFGVADLARAIGWDISRVYDTEFDHLDFLAGNSALLSEDQLLAVLTANDAQTVLTVRWRDGAVSDYLFALSEPIEIPRGSSPPQEADGEMLDVYTVAPVHLLSLGPRLLDLIRSQPAASPPHEGSKDYLECAYVDEEPQTVWVGAYETLDPRHLDALVRLWPGWLVQGHIEGVARQIILSGRDPTPFMVSQQQAIDELLDELSRNHGINPVGLARALPQMLPPEDRQGMKFGVGFFSQDAPLLSPRERREILKRLFESALEQGDASAVQSE